MSIIITTNEPKEIKELFEDRVETPMDYDFQLCTMRGPIPLERKAIPGDLIASVSDGRLARELRAMREVSRFYTVLLHGRLTFNKDGELVMRGHGHKWTRKGVRNLLRTIELFEGARLEWAETDEELVEVVNEIEEYFNKTHHLSLRVRPALDSNWLAPTREEKVRYFYQGLPSISAVRAKTLAGKYISPMDLYTASIEDIMELSGFGRTLAKGVYDFLREG